MEISGFLSVLLWVVCAIVIILGLFILLGLFIGESPSASQKLIKLLQDFKWKEEHERSSIVEHFLHIFPHVFSESGALEFVKGLSDENLETFFLLINEPLVSNEDRSFIYDHFINAETAKKILNYKKPPFYGTRMKKFEEFKGLIDTGLLPPEIISYLIAHLLELRPTENIGPICNYFSTLIEITDNPAELQRIALFWFTMMPDEARQKLLLMWVDEAVSPKVKNNVKNALLFINESPYSIVEGDQIMGDKISLKGDFRGANVPVKSILKDVNVAINNNTNVDQSTKDKLEELITELNEALQKIPPDMAEEAEAVARAAKMLAETVAEKKPNKTMVQITSEGLLKAAENLAKVMPTVLSIAKQIVALLTERAA